MARVLGRIRLSRAAEESTSVERQRHIIEGWAAAREHEIVGWASDPGVSGGLSPFDTPEFGAWLTKPDTWDIVVSWKLDRLGRTAFGLNRLFQWAQENEKTIVCVDDNIDLSTWVGRMVAGVIAGVAEGELEHTRERTRASHAHLRKLGRWHGGPVPYGYKAPKTDAGWYWEPNEPEAAFVRQTANLAIEGYSASAIARWLTDQGAKPRKSDRWTPNSARKMLRSRILLGQRSHTPKSGSGWKGTPRVVLGDDGMPLQFNPPILDQHTWDSVQEALDQLVKPRVRHNGVGLLKDVGWCECGAKLYYTVKTKQSMSYWRCSGRVRGQNDCKCPSIPASTLEGSVEESFLSILGDEEASEPEYQPGSDSTEDLARVKKALDLIRREADAGLYEDDEEGYLGRVRQLTERKRALEAEEIRPGQWVRKGLGVTYGELWQQRDTPGRRELLIKAGITVTARDKPLVVNFDVDLAKLRELVPGYQI